MNNPFNPIFFTDAYKTGHHRMYKDGTTVVYSNFTPRSLNILQRSFPDTTHVVSFGQQMVVRQLHEAFQNFFLADKQKVINQIKTEFSLALGDYDTTHFEELYDLGYLPIKIKSIPEGELVTAKIPLFTIVNTNPKFFWITNYLETYLSTLFWKPVTSATIAHQYKQLFVNNIKETHPELSWFASWQGHDFSMRGLDSIDSAISSGLGHATSFTGSDSIPAILGARKYYDAEGLVIGSVPATEHSVACSLADIDENGNTNELQGIRTLLAKFPKGILSMVSDTYDLWRMLTEYLPTLKDEIIARDGKLVIRPDSGDPVDIVCGSVKEIYNSHAEAVAAFPEASLSKPLNRIIRVQDEFYLVEAHQEADGDKHLTGTYDYIWTKLPSKPAYYGVIELLDSVFGHTLSSTGYKVLHPSIGCIYGDSITLERAKDIIERLKAKKYASTNIVFGIGSFTYQYNTRDSIGMACKTTYIENNGSPKELFKDPVTDSGTKKSARGLLEVRKHHCDGWVLRDRASKQGEACDDMVVIYENGVFSNQQTLQQIREKLEQAI
jgi:nicotinamide phosphoribosyltransferase